jgi:23S rRNA (uracil1939-C5)-methyltransferase
VRVRIMKKKRQYAEAQLLEVVSQSPHFVEPFCPHFGVCGGCQWQDLPYEEQLRWKRLHVLESLQHLAGIEEAGVAPTVPSPDTIYYRNKMEYTFSDRRWLSAQEIACKDIQYSKSLALGLHVRGFFDKVFNVESCFLESSRSVEILKEVRQWAIDSGLPAYSIRDHQGFWRFLVVREGKRTEQTLVHLLTTPQPENEHVVDALAKHLIERIPGITTFVHSVTQKKAQVAFGEESRTIFGSGIIEEELGGLRFRISAHSFFQTNPSAAERLFETVRSFGQFSGDEIVWDLYCGTGSIALSIASMVKRVVGFEVVQDAVDDAYVNCRLNGVDNCEFHAGDLKDVIKGVFEKNRFEGAPDVIVTDPPRSGMHPSVIKTLLEIAPKRIVAVSCNPSTLARDLSLLLDSYDVHEVQPFDLFPHTPHIECVVRLDRKQKS